MKPTALRLVEGTRDRRSRSARAGEPTPKGSLREPPEWFNLAQIASWHYALDHSPHALLKAIDRQMLINWVVAENVHRDACKKLGASSMLIKTTNGNAVQSPYLGIINRQVVLMKALAAELGFSPAARTQINVPDIEAAEDPTDRFFRK